jgi:CBS domain-containing protein
MRVRELMRRELPVVADEASLQEAGALLLESGAEVLPVARQDLLVGTVGYRELALGGCAAGRDPRRTRVAEVMSAGPARCLPDADPWAALELMREQGVAVLAVGESPERAEGYLLLPRLLEALARVERRPKGPLPEHVRRVRGDTP